MNYLNERLSVGNIGLWSIAVYAVASFFACYYYYQATFKSLSSESLEKSFIQKARIFFGLHLAAILSIFICLYWILIHHYFEYAYAYQHSNLELPFKYILSCFWEGQEGSFLLWSFWNAVIGFIFIIRNNKREKNILLIVAFFQLCLATMIIGLKIGDVSIGNNPFELLRQKMSDAPIFAQENYLSFIKDGMGLNALLQNYWMVIHPPILFLGFSLFTFPFAYCISALIHQNYEQMMKEVLAWGVIAGGVLGLGVMMGAAWAYESLTFGGYWAWDPVENASLVPWLMIVAAIHTNLIYIKTKRSLSISLLFYILSFLFVLYSTFLTRSGILGDTSVHSFTDLGIQTQLLVFLLIFVIPSIFLWLKQYKKIPFVHQEEKINSREFMMFIGSSILFLSALIISIKTSLPVFNKIFNTKFANPKDIEFSYNSHQIFVALLVCALTGIGFFLKFKSTPFSAYKKPILISLIISFILSILIVYSLPLEYYKKGLGFHYSIIACLFFSVFGVVANAFYLFKSVKSKWEKYGGPLAHLGFSLLIVGILISASQKKVLSWNTTGFSPLKSNQTENPLENITLVKGQKTDMGTYFVSYENNDSFNAQTKTNFYKITFEEKASKKSFSLYPDVIQNTKGQEGLTPNPDSKHFLTKDIFIYLTYVQDKNKQQEDTSQLKNIDLKIGDTFFYSKGFLRLSNVEKTLHQNVIQKFNLEKTAMGISASIEVEELNGNRYLAFPSLMIRNNEIYYLPDTVMANGLIFNLNKLVKNNQFQIGYKENEQALQFITLKAYEFPFINLVWWGVIVMVIGFILSSIKRFKKSSH